MKVKSILHCLIISVLISGVSASADPLHSREESDAYPKGYYNGDSLPEKTAYLTFDDGPSEWTESILDTLKKENVKATFFICAYWNYKTITGPGSFDKFKGSLFRMVREGHVLGNHTFAHKSIPQLSPDKIKRQFVYNQTLLNKVLGIDSPDMTILRMPQGQPWSRQTSLQRKKYVGSIVRDIGIVAMWTKEADSSDAWNWARGEWFKSSARVDTKNPSFIKKSVRVHDRIISNADGKGMVILMHDTHLVTRDVLQSVIADLKVKGYKFATMEDFVMWKYGKSSRELIRLK